MATNVNLRPFRDVDEHDVINLYRWSGSVPTNKGTFVKIVGSGFVTSQTDLDLLGSVGASYGNTVSERWGVKAQVGEANNSDSVIGMLLYDVKEVDENGQKLIFNPQKRDELEAVPSGEAVPIATRGVFMYSGVVGTPTVGGLAYVSGGRLAASTTVTGQSVGRFLGASDSDGWTLVKLDIV